MKAHLFLAAALICGGCATQQPAGAGADGTAGSGTVVQAGDANLTCVQIADEAATLSERMGDNTPGRLGAAVDVAKAGAAMLIPGAGLVIAGADALTDGERRRRELEAQALRDRWNYLNGLYIAGDCMQNASR
ncbi:MAG: hypothetical protein QME55_08930 [Brevundimonas sp.]|uniref:hypothetical protein n=1 Tax=Brevundimonas sp. TaxID=1871086 RepID=UPI0026042945|nr:hypothetical protein [Brevundimonas sp.]MDI6624840.1 hypothetical protein [Brevundimonas sp.]MDQ7811596.1 hypothetical protein [Brevundimonas sp.]